MGTDWESLSKKILEPQKNVIMICFLKSDSFVIYPRVSADEERFSA